MALGRDGSNRRAVVGITGALAALGSVTAALISIALPETADYFDTTPTVVGGGVASAFQLAFAVGHVLWGWQADVRGRITTLWIGLGLVALALPLCLIPSLEALVIARCLMGIGAAATLVVARALIRDVFSGAAYGRAMTELTMVFALLPGLAPVFGAGLVSLAGWHGVVAGLAAIVIGLAVGLFALSRLEGFRAALPPPRSLGLWECFGPPARSATFWWYSALAAIAISPMILLYAVGSSAYRAAFEIDAATAATHCFVVSVVAYLVGGEIHKRSLSRLSVTQQIACGAGLILLSALAALGATLGGVGVGGWTIGFSLYAIGLAFVLPTATRQAIALVPGAGAPASALAGMMLMLVPVVGTALFAAAETFGPTLALPIVVCVLALALTAAVGLWRLTTGVSSTAPSQS
ncbi:MAG: MFS transporter [Alphaproteobacteria bacterium]|nr:MAG: MFS transporter [Alphaproteobacteria bacterium]